MIPVLIESALRSRVVALVVAGGLRVFRVHHVVAQKAAWGLVLTTALAMPWILPTLGRWQLLPASASIALPTQAMTLLEELQARILTKSPSGRVPQPNTGAVPQGKSIEYEESGGSARETASTSPDKESKPTDARQLAPAPKEAMVYAVGHGEGTQGSLQPSRGALSSSFVFWFLYLAVAAVFFVR